jgi:hypothetical protein
MIDIEKRRKIGDIFRRGLGLPIKYRRNGDLVAPNLLGNCFERDLFLGFGREKCGRRGRKERMLRYLLVLVVILKLVKIWAAHVKSRERHNGRRAGESSWEDGLADY